MQIRISKSLGGGFEGNPKDIWNGQDYTDITKPVVFCGLYDLRDYYYLWRHKGKAYIFWCGGDLHNLENKFIFNDGKLKKLSTLFKGIFHRFIIRLLKKAENWVENGWEYDILKELGVESTICPSFFGNIFKYEISYQLEKPVNVYVSCGRGKQKQYGFDVIERIAPKLPDMNFHLYGDSWWTKEPNIYTHGRVPIEQMNRDMKDMQCGLRLNEYDGFSEITAKSILWGQYPISRIAYHLIPSYKTDEELIKLLQELSLKSEPNIKGRDYYLKTINNFPWV